MSDFSHLDPRGTASMVDVGGKPETRRESVAIGVVRFSAGTAALLRDNAIPKGDVWATARLAGIVAAKRTDELIPLCHTLPLHSIQVHFQLQSDRVLVRAIASSVGRTGIEMEALTAVSVAALTVYDMCKAVDRQMVIGPIYLRSKSGGRSGDHGRPDAPADAQEGDGPWR